MAFEGQKLVSEQESEIQRQRYKILERYIFKAPDRLKRWVGEYVAVILEAILVRLPRRRRTVDAVLEKYDGLAGSYVEFQKKSWDSSEPVLATVNGKTTSLPVKDYLAAVDRYHGDLIFKLDPRAASFLEVGVGEYTSLVGAVKAAGATPARVVGMDLSWSRLKVGEGYARGEGVEVCASVAGDVFQLPFLSDSFDIVYTVACLEQSPIDNERALSELYRVAGSYLILFEPSYEFGDRHQRRRMILQDFVRGLPDAIRKLNLKLDRHELCPIGGAFNCSALYVITKNPGGSGRLPKDFLACPRDQQRLESESGHLFNPRLGLVYPVIQDIACLRVKNAIPARRYA